MFQSSPVSQDGCKQDQRLRLAVDVGVSILTRLSGRVQVGDLGTFARGDLFQSSPVSQDGCKPSIANLPYMAHLVSILTRLSGRVQGRDQRRDLLGRLQVSILTRLSGRVQDEEIDTCVRLLGFQSSPVSQDGCKLHGIPGTSGAPNQVSILTRLSGRVQVDNPVVMACVLLMTRFNPHPSLRTGARTPRTKMCRASFWFQSSPVSQDGCKQCPFGAYRTAHNVSILTRLSGRVQDDDSPATHERSLCFNPHPSLRTGARPAVRRPDWGRKKVLLARTAHRVVCAMIPSSDWRL